MPTDPQTLFVFVIIPVIGFFLAKTYSKLEQIAKDITDIKISNASNEEKISGLQKDINTLNKVVFKDLV